MEAQGNGTSAPAQKPEPAGPIVIRNGRILPMSGPVVEGGMVIVVDGKITAVGKDLAVPEGAAVIDAAGGWAAPRAHRGALNGRAEGRVRAGRQ